MELCAKIQGNRLSIRVFTMYGQKFSVTWMMGLGGWSESKPDQAKLSPTQISWVFLPSSVTTSLVE